MSRAFVKEDVDIPERSARRRSASGLPPGALNYLTARGAQLLREEAAKLNAAGDAAAAVEAERILASATIVEPPESEPNVVTFGATVSIRATDGTLTSIRIVGVDEMRFDEEAVSWVSPLGRALLGAECGKTVVAGPDGPTVTIEKIEHG